MVRYKITKCVTTLTLLFIVPLLTFSSPRVCERYDNLNVVTTSLFQIGDTKKEIRNELVAEVTKYISEKYDKNKVLGNYFVDYGLKYNINISFMLAQAELETCFGKVGIGTPKSKRSIFGVVSRKYSSYSNCIEDYCKILKESYLVNGKTEHHLMKNYISKGGARYASSRSYEKVLKNKYELICRTTKIRNLQNKYKLAQS